MVVGSSACGPTGNGLSVSEKFAGRHSTNGAAPARPGWIGASRGTGGRRRPPLGQWILQPAAALPDWHESSAGRRRLRCLRGGLVQINACLALKLRTGPVSRCNPQPCRGALGANAALAEACRRGRGQGRCYRGWPHSPTPSTPLPVGGALARGCSAGHGAPRCSRAGPPLQGDGLLLWMQPGVSPLPGRRPRIPLPRWACRRPLQIAARPPALRGRLQSGARRRGRPVAHLLVFPLV